jgi:hypothetical protein
MHGRWDVEGINNHGSPEYEWLPVFEAFLTELGDKKGATGDPVKGLAGLASRGSQSDRPIHLGSEIRPNKKGPRPALA